MAEETDRASEQGGFNPEFAHDMQPRGPLQLLRVESEYAQYWSGGPLEGEVVTVCEPAGQVFVKIQDALASHAEAQHLTDTIQNSLATGSDNTAEIRSALAASTEAMAKINNFLNECVASFPTRMRPTSNSHVKAEQVFATAELFEAIFLHLSPAELLRAVGVNHATFDNFKDSPKLQDTLQLRAHKEGYLSNVVGQHFNSFHVSLDNLGAVEQLQSQWHHSPFNQVPVIVSVRKHSGLRIGGRCREMLILNPPVLSMKVSVSCCPPKVGRTIYFRTNGWNEGEEAFISFDTPSRGHVSEDEDSNEEEEGESEAMESDDGEGDDDEENDGENYYEVLNAGVVQTLKIFSRTGIIIGDIYDAVQRLRKAHENCPHASVRDHADDGTVKPSITFTALLDLKKDDPYLFEREAAVIRDRLEKHSDTGRQGIMQVFVDSKKRAFERQWPILTFESSRRSTTWILL